MSKFSSLTSRLLLNYLLITVVPMVCITLFILSSFENSLRHTTLENLSTIADKKMDQIDAYISERILDISQLMHRSLVHKAMADFSSAYRTGGVDSAAYRAAEMLLRENLENIVKASGYWDLLLIDTQGNVVFSVARENDLGSNLLTGPYRQLALAQGFDLAIHTLSVSTSRFEPYSPSQNRPAAFIVAPILENGIPQGALALQVDLDSLQAVVSDRTGLGLTGETVLAQHDGDDVLYTAPLKHVFNAAYHHRVPFQAADPATQMALSHYHGSGIFDDYAGKKTVTVWRFLPALRWGMVVKIDIAEALAPTARLRTAAYTVLGGLLLLSAIIAYFLGRRLTRPIDSLIQTSDRIAAGESQLRIPSNEHEHIAEFGRMASAFNHMAAAVEEAQHNLEHKVKERTEAFQNISRLQQAVLDNAAYAVIATNQDGVITVFNHAAEQMLGYTAQEMIGIATPAIFHDFEEVVARAKMYSETLKTPVEPGFEVFVVHTRLGLPNDFEWTYRHKDGHCFQVLLRITALRNENGETTGYLGIAADITARKQAEAAMIEAKQAAESANKAKSEFLANMSHEIRTPMNGVLGITRLLLDTELNTLQKSYLKKIHASSNILLSILNDILDYSKIEAGRLEIEHIPLNVRNVLRQTMDLFSVILEEKGLAVFFDIDPKTPVEVLGDPLRLAQVLNNLMGNAVKFTDQGEIRLGVSTLSATDNTLMLGFSVSDTGIGISKDQAELLFQAFTQADSSITRKYGGTGLGLSICHKLVGLMGGEISATGIEGKGSTFSFTIQVGRSPKVGLDYDYDASSDDNRRSATRNDMTPPNAPGLEGKQVLLVEDNAINQAVAAGFLQKHGINVTIANHGAEAVDWVQRKSFDLVLMDLHMPAMGGLEAARQIRALPCGENLPIVAMTAAVLQSDREQCQEVGMSAFLSKPIDPDALKDCLNRVIHFHAVANAENSPQQPHAPDALELVVPGFDLKAALNRLEGDSALLARLLRNFAEEHTDVAARLDTLLQHGDNTQAILLLHTLRGVAANLGIVTLAETALRLEDEIRTGDKPQSFGAFADALRAALAAINAAIKTENASFASTLDYNSLQEVLHEISLFEQESPLLLLVDDVPANLHVLVSMLREHYRIQTATSGEKALKMIGQEIPDLILLDIMLPGISGIEVIRQLRQRKETQEIAIIIISADPTEQTQLDGLELGADEYLLKPVAKKVLLLRVKNLLQRKFSEKRLRLAAHVFESSGEAILITDKNNCILEVNQAFVRLTGYRLEDIKGMNPRLLSAGRTDPEVYRAMWRAICEKDFWQGELWDKDKNGRIYPKLITISLVRNAHGEVDFYIASFTDISERKAAEEHINRLAHRDSLTGLLNRFSLLTSFEQVLARTKREKHQLAVMFIDMDRFKVINDTLGHAAGDALLIEVAQRLLHGVRESDLVGRWGGDEFVVALSEVDDANAAKRVAEKILTTLGEPYRFEDNPMSSSPSIGVALYPDDGDDCDTLLKNADTAMYHAKSNGRNNVQFFTEKMQQEVQNRLMLERELRVALDQRQFELHYQPQLETKSGKIVGFEALIRWKHPQQGMILPAQFIPIAEETGLILPLGNWVLNEACRQLKQWKAHGHADIKIAVNLSAQQLRSPTLISDIYVAYSHNGLQGSDIELEITESVAMHDPFASIGKLNALRLMGIQLSIDDFGTGYSSLSYLKQMPVQVLKLDQSFVRDIETDPNDSLICSATINLAHDLGLKVVAEGVETEAQRDFLVSLNCDILQGYLYGHPAPGIEAEKYLSGSR